MIAIGRVRKSVGLKGEVKVMPLGDEPQRFLELTAVWVGEQETGTTKYSVRSVRMHGSDPVLTIEGIGTRTEADQLRGKLLFVQDEEAVKPSKGSYFVHEIVGLKVVTEEGVAVGEVSDVLSLPAGDVWAVQAEGKEVLIPAVKEIVRSVDLNGKTIVIRAIEGLLG